MAQRKELSHREPALAESKVSSIVTQQIPSVIEHLRRPKGPLAKLLAQTDKLQHINRIFNAYLPPHLHGHAMITTMSPKQWVVQTDSSAWATRLRYVLPNLREQMRDHLKKEVPLLTVRIITDSTVAKSASEPRRMQLTEETAQLLEGTARDMNDQRLGSALLRLSRHVAKSSK
jgi:hypothetical protein